MMRFVDILYAFPTLVFVIVILPRCSTRKSLVLLFALIGAISWLTMARIVRGQVLSLRHREFVEAARASAPRPRASCSATSCPTRLGAGHRLRHRHRCPGVMLTEAFLSFLGLGVQAPRASWGTLVSEGAGASRSTRGCWSARASSWA